MTDTIKEESVERVELLRDIANQKLGSDWKKIVILSILIVLIFCLILIIT